MEEYDLFFKNLICDPSDIDGKYKVIPDRNIKYGEKYLLVSYQEYVEIEAKSKDLSNE